MLLIQTTTICTEIIIYINRTIVMINVSVAIWKAHMRTTRTHMRSRVFCANNSTSPCMGCLQLMLRKYDIHWNRTPISEHEASAFKWNCVYTRYFRCANVQSFGKLFVLPKRSKCVEPNLFAWFSAHLMRYNFFFSCGFFLSFSFSFIRMASFCFW